MNSTSDEHPRKYTDEQIREILGRAISISDLEASLWSRADLVQIAAELNIPERILEQAITDIDARDANEKATMPWRDFLTVGVIGAALSAAGLLVNNSTIPILAVSITSILLALDSRRRDAYAKYLLRNGALWGAFYGVILTEMGIEATSAAVVTGMCVTAGTLAMALIRSLNPQNPLAGFTRKAVRFVSKQLERLTAPAASYIEHNVA